jgi:hypothetical protein
MYRTASGNERDKDSTYVLRLIEFLTRSLPLAVL